MNLAFMIPAGPHDFMPTGSIRFDINGNPGPSNDPQACKAEETKVEAFKENPGYRHHGFGKYPYSSDVKAQYKKELFDTNFLKNLIEKCSQVLSNEKTIPHITVDLNFVTRFVIVGDVHGQFYDVLKIFSMHGNPSLENQYLFNGDFVDRGPDSLEIVILLMMWKIVFPDAFFLNRGNHEIKNTNGQQGFLKECREKLGDVEGTQIWEHINDKVFKFLPLGHVLKTKISGHDSNLLVVHGGIPEGMSGEKQSSDRWILQKEEIVKANSGETLDRKVTDFGRLNACDYKPGDEVAHEFLWNDPIDPAKEKNDGNGGFRTGRGGAATGTKMFGRGALDQFLKNTQVDCIFRSHEPERTRGSGFMEHFGGLLYTVFSAPQFNARGGHPKLLNFNDPDPGAVFVFGREHASLTSGFEPCDRQNHKKFRVYADLGGKLSMPKEEDIKPEDPKILFGTFHQFYEEPARIRKDANGLIESKPIVTQPPVAAVAQ